jgi:hypothetical protein
MIHPTGNMSRKALKPATLLLSALVLFTTGCAMQQFSDTGAHSLTVKGTAFGGQPPVTGSTITMYATGKTGYGSAATVMGTATTNASGNFNITSAVSCSDPQQVYLVASGGNPGLAAGTNNAALVMVAALGNCSSVSASTTVDINEVTTIAAAYALSGFADSTINIGTSATNPTGLQHAFQNANNIVDFTAGAARTTTPAGNGTVPTYVINTLADVLEPCINSTGPGSTACTALFPAAQPPSVTGIAAPTTTWQAALDMAQYPANNTATLYGLVLATPSFSPTLATAPGDLSIAVTYTAGLGSDGVTAAVDAWGIAADSGDNLWVTGLGKAGLVELSSVGAVLSPNGGWGTAALQNSVFTHQVAVDLHGNVVTVDSATPANVFIYNVAAATTTVIQPGTLALAGVAIDASNNLWYSSRSSATTGQTIGQLAYSGGAFATTPTTFTGSPALTGTGIYALTVDAVTGNVWGGSQSGGSTFYYLSPYTSPVGSVTTVGTLNYAAAIDKNGNTWITNTTTGFNKSALFEVAKGAPSALANTYTVTASTGSGLDGSRSVMVDGNNRLFINSYTANTIVEFDPALAGGSFLVNSVGTGFSPTTSAGVAVLNGSRTSAIDAAGALWTVNANGTQPVIQILGVAAPTVAILAQGKYGVKP